MSREKIETRRTGRKPGPVTRRQLLGGSAAAGAGLLTARSAATAAPSGGLFGGKAPAFRIQESEKTAIVVGEADLETLRVDTWGSLLQYQAYRAIYEPLVHYNTKPGPDGTLYYDPENLDFRSAESVEVLDDGKTLHWKIRPGQTFENGRVIDAKAWEQTFHWHFDRKGVGLAQAQVNGTLKSKEDIYAEGNDILVMKFAEPNPWMISAFYILNQVGHRRRRDHEARHRPRTRTASAGWSRTRSPPGRTGWRSGCAVSNWCSAPALTTGPANRTSMSWSSGSFPMPRFGTS